MDNQFHVKLNELMESFMKMDQIQTKKIQQLTDTLKVCLESINSMNDLFESFDKDNAKLEDKLHSLGSIVSIVIDGCEEMDSRVSGEIATINNKMNQ